MVVSIVAGNPAPAISTPVPPPLQANVNAGAKLDVYDLNFASAALLLALLKLTNTILAKMPMIAMTTSNSMRVKPRRAVIMSYLSMKSVFVIDKRKRPHL